MSNSLIQGSTPRRYKAQLCLYVGGGSAPVFCVSHHVKCPFTNCISHDVKSTHPKGTKMISRNTNPQTTVAAPTVSLNNPAPTTVTVDVPSVHYAIRDISAMLAPFIDNANRAVATWERASSNMTQRLIRATVAYVALQPEATPRDVSAWLAEKVPSSKVPGTVANIRTRISKAFSDTATRVKAMRHFVNADIANVDDATFADLVATGADVIAARVAFLNQAKATDATPDKTPDVQGEAPPHDAGKGETTLKGAAVTAKERATFIQEHLSALVALCGEGDLDAMQALTETYASMSAHFTSGENALLAFQVSKLEADETKAASEAATATVAAFLQETGTHAGTFKKAA